MKPRLVLDTNIFVAAGFNPASASAEVLRKIEAGEIELVWDNFTRAETRQIINQIPPLSWERFERIFEQNTSFSGKTNPEQFTLVSDPEDRKFAALATAADAVLLTNDDHLLSVRQQLEISIFTPGDWLRLQNE
jgi:uncharacterized protein